MVYLLRYIRDYYKPGLWREGTFTSLKWFYKTHMFYICFIKLILLKKMQCVVKSKVLARVECIKDNDTAISFHLTTINEIASFYGISNLYIYVNAIKNVLQFKGYRIELCKPSADRHQPQFLSLINTGRRVATTNFTQKCPFLGVSLGACECIQERINNVPCLMIVEYHLRNGSHAVRCQICTQLFTGI